MRAEHLRRALGVARLGPRRRRHQPIVLLYHRVGRVPSDPQLLCVTPDHFADHLQVIAGRHTPVRLGSLSAAALNGNVPPGAVAVTFDDGYLDNLLVAKPLLERSGIPATVFVTSGYVRNGRPFWWDELEHLLLRPGRLPAALTLEVGREKLRWELGDDAAYVSDREGDRTAWTVLDDRDPGPRELIYRALCERFRALDETDRERALEHLRAVAEHDDAADALMPRPLSPTELTRLAEGDLIEVGAHTVTHPVLSHLPAERQREEVAGSKRQLEEIVGRPVSSFAYPYGAATDFDETTVSVVREAGFGRACANVPGRVTRQTDPFRLPRLVVRDYDGDELARRLSALSP
jgi:peptidoglycan/xylan/chitin deacetylase (PgdA/CDA1 family)